MLKNCEGPPRNKTFICSYQESPSQLIENPMQPDIFSSELEMPQLQMRLTIGGGEAFVPFETKNGLVGFLIIENYHTYCLRSLVFVSDSYYFCRI